jgi:hypothetical protein
MVFWACSRFILSQWMKFLSSYFTGFDLGNADLNRSEEQSDSVRQQEDIY